MNRRIDRGKNPILSDQQIFARRADPHASFAVSATACHRAARRVAGKNKIRQPGLTDANQPAAGASKPKIAARVSADRTHAARPVIARQCRLVKARFPDARQTGEFKSRPPVAFAICEKTGHPVVQPVRIGFEPRDNSIRSDVHDPAPGFVQPHTASRVRIQVETRPQAGESFSQFQNLKFQLPVRQFYQTAVGNRPDGAIRGRT